MTSNDVSKLGPGKVQYTYLPNENGGIVDDLLVYNMQHGDDHHYILVVNAGNIQKDWDWIKATTLLMPSWRTSATTWVFSPCKDPRLWIR